MRFYLCWMSGRLLYVICPMLIIVQMQNHDTNMSSYLTTWPVHFYVQDAHGTVVSLDLSNFDMFGAWWSKISYQQFLCFEMTWKLSFLLLLFIQNVVVMLVGMCSYLIGRHAASLFYIHNIRHFHLVICFFIEVIPYYYWLSECANGMLMLPRLLDVRVIVSHLMLCVVSTKSFFFFFFFLKLWSISHCYLLNCACLLRQFKVAARASLL